MLRGWRLSAVAPELDRPPRLSPSHLTLRDHLPCLPWAGPLGRTEPWMLSSLSPRPRALSQSCEPSRGLT